jgi:hypothetical protein
MSHGTFDPPVDILNDFQTMNLAILDDRSGDKTRRLFEYLNDAEQRCLEMRFRTTDYEEQRFAGMLSDAFSASGRIVVAAWEKAHDRELAI